MKKYKRKLAKLSFSTDIIEFLTDKGWLDYSYKGSIERGDDVIIILEKETNA